MSHRFPWYARLLVVLAVLVPCVLPCNSAHAGGLFLFDRGARALGRAGAFVASPDDPSALWYNPAGLTESKNQLIIDATLPILLADYQRQLPDGSYATSIKARPIPIPIPTFAFSAMIGEHLAIGGGVFAPNVLVMAWEKSVDRGATPAPTRYSLTGLQGSLLANIAAGFALKFGSLSVGVDAQVPIGKFQARTAISACDATLCAYPEQPDFDAYATANAVPAYGITGTAGVVLDLDAVRFGFSASLPYTLKGDGKLKLQLPSNAAFDDASVDGDTKTSFAMKMPMILRAGGEMRPLPYLRMEGAFVWEGWSAQKSIDVDVKSPLAITGIAGGGGDWGVNSIKIQRNMKDVWSLRGGGELEIPKRWMVVDIDIVLRGGIAYETSAFDKKDLSPITLDSNKFIMSGGLTVGVLDWLRLDTVAGWVFMQNQNVNINVSQVRQPAGISPTNPREGTVIGAGKYAMDAFYLGGGLRMLFDGSFREPSKKRQTRRRRAESEAAAVQKAEEDKPDAMPVLDVVEGDEEE